MIRIAIVCVACFFVGGCAGFTTWAQQNAAGIAAAGVGAGIAASASTVAVNIDSISDKK